MKLSQPEVWPKLTVRKNNKLSESQRIEEKENQLHVYTWGLSGILIYSPATHVRLKYLEIATCSSLYTNFQKLLQEKLTPFFGHL